MKFESIIGHCAELLSLLLKSPNPSDKLSSQFFRKKKYIGSKERKFISETVFQALRMDYLLDYLADELIQQIGENTGKSKNEKEKRFDRAFLKTAVLLLFNDLFPGFIKNYNLYKFNQYFVPTNNLINEIINIITSKFHITFIFANNWIENLKLKFDDLESNVNMSLNNINLTDSNLDNWEKYFSFPKDLIKRLSGSPSVKNTKELYELLHSLYGSANLCIRVNTNMTSIDSVIKELEETGAKPRISELSPQGVIANSRVQLNNLESFRNGLIEVQDEGSQLIAYAIDPAQNERIFDACAGAGGKTLHIASLQNDMGNILAGDIEFNRLKELQKRARRSAFNSIETIVLKSPKSRKAFESKSPEFDAVLVDAPCSGTGTVRRSPKYKYRLNASLLRRLTKNQSDILNYYSQFVKNGGLLVYSTCSILPDENHQVAENFLNVDDSFIKEDLYKIFADYNIHAKGLEKGSYCLSLFPSVHGTDGFFIAVFRKVKED